MKLAVFLAFFAVLAYASAMSSPDAVYDGPTYELTAVDDSEDGTDMNSEELAPFRQRRVTCDLLSWQSSWLSVNHAACAARCIAQRRKGGVCRDGVCVCRR